MIVKVLRLVFLFIILMKFSKGKSIADIIRSRYGEAFARKIRKFKKNDYKLQKCHLDLKFLLECEKNNLIPSFRNSNQQRRQLRNYVVYKKYQIKTISRRNQSKGEKNYYLGKERKEDQKRVTRNPFLFKFLIYLLFVSSC